MENSHNKCVNNNNNNNNDNRKVSSKFHHQSISTKNQKFNQLINYQLKSVYDDDKTISYLLNELFVVLKEPKHICSYRQNCMHYCQQIPMRQRSLPKSFFVSPLSHASNSSSVQKQQLSDTAIITYNNNNNNNIPSITYNHHTTPANHITPVNQTPSCLGRSNRNCVEVSRPSLDIRGRKMLTNNVSISRNHRYKLYRYSNHRRASVELAMLKNKEKMKLLSNRFSIPRPNQSISQVSSSSFLQESTSSFPNEVNWEPTDNQYHRSSLVSVNDHLSNNHNQSFSITNDLHNANNNNRTIEPIMNNQEPSFFSFTPEINPGMIIESNNEMEKCYQADNGLIGDEYLNLSELNIDSIIDTSLGKFEFV